MHDFLQSRYHILYIIPFFGCVGLSFHSCCLMLFVFIQFQIKREIGIVLI